MLKKHRQEAPEQVSVAVVTVSDTRNKETDKSGKRIMDLLQSVGYTISFYEIIPDEKDRIEKTIKQATAQKNVQAVIMNGGTGISKRDVSIETIEPMFTKELSGFGELFRYLSYELDIGSASILSRATAGVINDRIVFAVPGSSGAVKLAMEKLILPEIGHIVRELEKDLNGNE